MDLTFPSNQISAFPKQIKLFAEFSHFFSFFPQQDSVVHMKISLIFIKDKSYVSTTFNYSVTNIIIRSRKLIMLY